MKRNPFSYAKLNRGGSLLAAAAIAFISFWVQGPYLNEFPAYIHAWAQSDWYAIAIGFVNNGMDLFHPESLVLNKQFPGGWGTESATAITPAGFPILAYLAAGTMKLAGTTAPWTFRIWTFLFSGIGIFFLYRLSFLLTKDTLKSLLVAIIALTAPTYSYYSSGFLPTLPALTLSIAALAAYCRYSTEGWTHGFHLALAAATLATLIRTPFAVVLVAMLCFEVLAIMRKERAWKDKLATALCCAAILAASFWWNRHLRAEHGSLFLNSLMPPRDWIDAREVFKNIHKKWRFQYFQQFQHWAILAIAAAAAACAVWRRTKGLTSHNSGRGPSIWWLWGILFFGELIYAAVMFRQYYEHDYYFLDSLFLPLLLLTILLLRSLPCIRSWKIGLPALAALIVIGNVMMVQDRHEQKFRRDPFDGALLSTSRYQGASALLDKAGAQADDKILVLFAYPQQSALIQCHRQGFVVMDSSPELLENAKRFSADWVAVEHDAFCRNFESCKQQLSHLRPLIYDADLSICQWSDSIVVQSAREYAEITGYEPRNH